MDELANSPLPLRYKTASAVDPKATGAIARIVVEAIDSYNTEITEATMNISKRLL